MYTTDLDYDVIIVGGGISGLTSALAIHERDPLLTVLILEANAIPGGRTRQVTLETSSYTKKAYHLGGHFINRRQTHLVQMLEKFNIPILDYGTTGFCMFEDDLIQQIEGGLPIFIGDETKSQLKQFFKKLDVLCSEISFENPMASMENEHLDSITLDEFLQENLTTSTLDYFRNILRFTCGVEPTRISALFYLAFSNSTGGAFTSFLRKDNTGKLSYIPGGMTLLSEQIMAIIGRDNILVNNAVNKICREEHDTMVFTSEKKFRCRSVILAIPAKQLLGIAFEPPLDKSRMDVLRKIKGKRWLKFVATYKEQFWKDSAYNRDLFSNNPGNQVCPIVVVYDISCDDNAALTGLVDIGKHPQHFFKVRYDKEVLHQLAAYFGEDSLKPLDYSERFWPDGGYDSSMINCPLPGCMKSFHEIRKPAGRLYFAGAETATYWYGHISGAIQSGLRAALEVLYEIRPQVLGMSDFAELKLERETHHGLEQRQPEATYWLRNTVGIFLVLYIACLIVAYAKTLYKSPPLLLYR